MVECEFFGLVIIGNEKNVGIECMVGFFWVDCGFVYGDVVGLGGCDVKNDFG